jgi:hypothetical protein
MSDVPGHSNGVPLREYLERVIDGHMREVQGKIGAVETLIHGHQREWAGKQIAMEAAVLLAREDVSRRLTELNQLRREVIEDRDQFVSKHQFEPMMRERDSWREGVSDRITKVETHHTGWTQDVDRRLADLNKLREEVVEDREQFVSKNYFDPMMRERNAWRDAISDRLNINSDRITRIETKGNTWTVAVGVFFVVLQIALQLFLRK